jgi:hypothetical protein
MMMSKKKKITKISVISDKNKQVFAVKKSVDALPKKLEVIP